MSGCIVPKDEEEEANGEGLEANVEDNTNETNE